MDKFTDRDKAYMRRALYLATHGGGRVSPNPMVGAVIVADDRIISEGFHRLYGENHAERNAILSINPEDRHLLKKSTMYVTLEPCTHYGKTPPCADLIIESGIPKVVISSADPFLDSKRKGFDVLRKAGVDVRFGLLRDESLFMNRKFMTAHTLKRPYVTLKWAQTADGIIGKEGSRLMISNPLTEVLMHKERAANDAVMVGIDTAVKDNPKLTCRLWPVRDSRNRPRKVSFDSERMPPDSVLADSNPILKHRNETLSDFLNRLYEDYGITSVLIEGGRKTLQSFIDQGLADEIRIEISSQTGGEGISAPDLTALDLNNKFRCVEEKNFRGNMIKKFVKNY